MRAWQFLHQELSSCIALGAAVVGTVARPAGQQIRLNITDVAQPLSDIEPLPLGERIATFSKLSTGNPLPSPQATGAPANNNPSLPPSV